MPFKSKAQRRKFAELLVKGEITPETYEEWNRETGSRQLPERVKPKGSARPTMRRKKSPARKRSTATTARKIAPAATPRRRTRRKTARSSKH